MRSTESRRAALIGAGALIVLAALSLHSAAQPAVSTDAARASEGAPEEKSDEVRSLLEEKLQVLRELLAGARDLHATGRADTVEVSAAALRVLDCELELAKTRDEQLRALREQLEIQRSIERLTDERFSAGVASRSDALSAKASRLDAQIRLARKLATEH